MKKVYVAKKPSRFTKGKYPEVDGTIRIDVSSASKNKLNGVPMNQLSPMKLFMTKEQCLFENYRQFGKVYDCHVDDDGNIQDNYWIWRQNGRKLDKGKRRPFPKKLNKKHGVRLQFQKLEEDAPHQSLKKHIS